VDARGQAELHPIALTELDKRTLSGAIENITGRRQREKCCAYVKAAFTWAAGKREAESGLGGVVPWWIALQAGDPDPDEMDALESRRAALLQAKTDFTITHLAELLVRHEAYCADRTGNDRISPGIRYGLWWVAFTAHRRGSTVQLLRDDLLEQDPFGEAGWGRAAWSAEAMNEADHRPVGVGFRHRGRARLPCGRHIRHRPGECTTYPFARV
jgi:hypothetical protein